MEPLVRLQDVRKTYPMQGGDVHALKEIELEFHEGEFSAIVGTSGSGKSTLLYLLGMLSEPSAGYYWFRGKETGTLTDLERSRLRGREIGFVFQSFHLVPQLDILKNVLLAARYTGAAAGAAGNGHGGSAAGGGNGTDFRRRATELLDDVGLSHRMGHRPIELSNGEMQRVAIARALLTEPSLILADEPTGNLDEENGNHVFELLERLSRDEGKTVIMVTHDMSMAERTPRLVRLKNGEVLA